MTYHLLYHNELDIQHLDKNYSKTIKQLQAGDFNSADVRKMTTKGFYLAKLNAKDRLLFTPVKHNGQTYLLLLEFIKDHNYAHSRFLRGASLPADDQLLPVADANLESDNPIQKLAYLNPVTQSVHVLNKFISFDEIQASVMTLQPPLIIIGSAGSGKQYWC